MFQILIFALFQLSTADTISPIPTISAEYHPSTLISATAIPLPTIEVIEPICGENTRYSPVSLISIYADCISIHFLEIVFAFFLVCWLIVLAAWLFNWFRHRYYRLWLHKAISALLLLKILVQIAKFITAHDYYSSFVDRPFMGFTIALEFVSAGFEVLVFLLISKGWGPTKTFIPKHDMIVPVICSLTFAVYSLGNYSTTHSDTAIVLLFTLYTLFHINRSIRSNERFLYESSMRLGIWHLKPDPWNPSDFPNFPLDDAEQLQVPFDPKVLALTRFQIVVNLWFVGIFYANFFTKSRMIILFTREIADFLLYTSLAFSFRLRDPKLFELKTEERYPGNGDPVDALRRRIAQLQSTPETPVPNNIPAETVVETPTATTKKRFVLVVPVGKRTREIKMLTEI
jgi:hypothetical protein